MPTIATADETCDFLEIHLTFPRVPSRSSHCRGRQRSPGRVSNVGERPRDETHDRGWYHSGMADESPTERAARDATLGLPIPTGAKHRLIKRIVLRSTWFLMRHQMDHNLAMLRAVEDLAARTAEVEAQVAAHRHHVAQLLTGLEASLRAEILGPDRRSDQIETDLVRLMATVSALQATLESMVISVDENVESVAALRETDVAEVRALPGQSRR